MDFIERSDSNYLKSIFILAVGLVLCVPESIFAQANSSLPQEVRNLENVDVFPADAQPTSTIKLEKTQIFQETDDVLFGRIIHDIRVDDEGRIYIMDLIRNQVHIFGANANFLQSVGRSGRGPGEFLRIADIQVGNGKLHIIDRRQQKISLFKLGSFEHIEDIDISFQAHNAHPSWLQRTRENRTAYRPTDLILQSPENYFIIFSDGGVATPMNLPGRRYEFSLFGTEEDNYLRHNVLSFDWTGGVRLIKQAGSNRTSISFFVPYKRRSHFDYANSTLVHGWTEHFLFKIYDENGNYQQAFYYPFEKQPLTIDNILAYTNDTEGRTKSLLQQDLLPDTWPAFHTLVLDDQNRLWVSSFTNDPDQHKWRILEPSGQLLASFTLHKKYDLQQVKNGAAYALVQNQDGLYSVQQFNFSLE